MKGEISLPFMIHGRIQAMMGGYSNIQIFTVTCSFFARVIEIYTLHQASNRSTSINFHTNKGPTSEYIEGFTKNPSLASTSLPRARVSRRWARSLYTTQGIEIPTSNIKEEQHNSRHKQRNLLRRSEHRGEPPYTGEL